MKLGKATLLAAACLGLLGLANAARADSIDPSTNLIETNLGGGEYAYTITMVVSSNSDVIPIGSHNIADYFELDGLGTITSPSDSGVPAGQAWTSSITGSTLKFTYTGSTNPVIGPETLGTFSFDSNVDLSALPMLTDPITLEPYQISGSAVYLNKSPQTQEQNTIEVLVTPAVSSSVPVPAAGWMGISTLLGMGGLMMLRKSRKASLA